MAEEKRKTRVLVIDDDAFMRKIFAVALGSLGAEVVGSAADGREGIGMYADLAPDITFLDIHMPGFNGIDALKAIFEENGDAAVVMLTSEDRTEVAETCLHLGAKDFINKSLDHGKIRERVNRAIETYT